MAVIMTLHFKIGYFYLLQRSAGEDLAVHHTHTHTQRPREAGKENQNEKPKQKIFTYMRTSLFRSNSGEQVKMK